MILRRLKLRARAFFAPRRVERDLDEELAFHIERETRKHLANGLSPAEARTRAKARFGSVTVAADECRDARGTALVDGVVRDVLYACRSFRRAPLVALTIVTTVGLGLGLVAVVFTLLNGGLFRVDDVRNPHELFAVVRQRSANAEPERFTRPHYEALGRETGVFSDAFATMDVDSRIDGRRMEGSLVTGNFFHVLGVSAARGRTLTPSDDERGGRPALVLSHRAWSRHFASDPGVLNRSLLVNGVPFQIVGVMPESFRGLVVAAPDFWAPLALVGHFRRAHAGREDSVGIGIIGRLKPGLSRGQALAELAVWDSRRERAVERPAASGVERPVANLILEPKSGTAPLSAETMLLFTPLFFAFGLILLIGCANVANLLLARAVARQREIGIRLAIGASRRRIICQLLTESLLLALVSAGLAFGISRLVLEAVIYAVTSTMPPDLGDVRLAMPPGDWRVALFLVGGAVYRPCSSRSCPRFRPPASSSSGRCAVKSCVMRVPAAPGTFSSPFRSRHPPCSSSARPCSCAARWPQRPSIPESAQPTPSSWTSRTKQTRGAVLEALRREPSVAAVAASWPGALGPGRSAFAQASPSTKASASAETTADKSADKSADRPP